MGKLIIFIIGVYLLGLNSFVWAGDTLIKTLKEKGVITEEEASTIMTEAAKEKKSVLPKGLEGISIGGVAYIDYSVGTTNKDGTDFNKFSLTRGYINLKKDINPWLKVRVTPDVTLINAVNSQKGDLELRMKYYYADFLLPDYNIFTDNDLRVGLAQIPWLEFLENINLYRMQGTMFQERVGNFNSADLGVGLIGNTGGKLSKETQEKVGYSTPYSGRYGSYHIGVYNGGGYHATEENQNKVIEGRITVRPLPDSVPGLQLTYFGLSGKGNKSTNPDWSSHSAFISYQNRNMVLTGEFVQAKGNQKGDNENDKTGFSLFGDFRLPFNEAINVVARYDVWDPDTDTSGDKETLTIAGVSYRLYEKNYILLAYEQKQYDAAGDEDDKKGQVVYQISY